MSTLGDTGAVASQTAADSQAPARRAPNNSPDSRMSFADEVLRRLGITWNSNNVVALAAWARAEGGHWNNSAKYNPLNTTLKKPGSTSINSAGVQSYASWDEGLQATVDTLRLPAYSGVLAALKNGNVDKIDSAVGSSPWGTPAGRIKAIVQGEKGVATPDNVVSDVANALNPLSWTAALGKLLNQIESGQFWLNVGKVLGGIIAIVLGVRYIGAQFVR